jgi:NTP pyrophosphatase (non-canonical NTP hydrolase)
MTESDAPLTLAGFQAWIHERYYATDNARGTPATFLWFVEELGELATALQNGADPAASPEQRANLAEEFADVLAWLCTLANINAVDLEAAVRAKYLAGDGPVGHKG